MKKLFTKVLCSLLLVAAFNQANAQTVETYSNFSNETIQITSNFATRGDNWLYYDNGAFEDAIGGQTLEFMMWGIMIPANKLSADQLITKVSFFNYAVHEGEINIFFGGTDAPDQNMLIHKQAYSATTTNEFLEFELTSPLPVFEGENLWVILSTNNGYQFPASISPNKNDKNGRWISLDGTNWYDLTYFGIDGTFMVRVCVEGGESVSELNSSLSIYPNPAKDQLFVETEMAVEEISVYDVFGRQQLAISGQQSAVDVSNLSDGVYFVKVKSENNEVVKRFIKK